MKRGTSDGEVNAMLPAPMVRRGFVGDGCGAGLVGGSLDSAAAGCTADLAVATPLLKIIQPHVEVRVLRHETHLLCAHSPQGLAGVVVALAAWISLVRSRISLDRRSSLSFCCSSSWTVRHCWSAIT